MTDDAKEILSGPMPSLPVIIHTQYIKDLSFENPHAPNSLRAGQTQKPQLDVNILLDANPLEDAELKALYEVVMTVRAQSKRGDRTDYIAEVVYGAAVSLTNVPEDQRHPLLFIEVPRQLFPFVRQAMVQVTQGGGYAPLYLSPIDFHGMYLNRFGKEAPVGNA